MAFTTLAVSQLLHTVSARDPDLSFYGKIEYPKNPYIACSIGSGLFLQFLAISNPSFRRILGTRALSLTDLSVCLGGAAAHFIYTEAKKQSFTNTSGSLKLPIPTVSELIKPTIGH